MKLRGNFHDLQIIDMQGCVGFYFLLFDIYTTDILLFCTRVMKRCFLGHFRLKLTPFPYRLWQRFRLTKYVLNWIKSWVTFENYFIPLHFKLFNGVNVFIVELILLYQTPTKGYHLWWVFDKVTLSHTVW